jgi:hypothetical protein
MVREISSPPDKVGKLSHKVRTRARDIKEPERNRVCLDSLGLNLSFITSFTASLMGWSRPFHPSLLGPFRNWVYLRNFRSSKVKKATLIRAQAKITISLERARTFTW